MDSYRVVSRDLARTPFQWDSTDNSGFSTATFTWLPVNPSFSSVNLDAQVNAEQSHYKLYKDLLQLRRNVSFANGDYNSKVLGSNVFSYARSYGGVSFVVAINFGDVNEDVDVSVFDVNLKDESKIHLAATNSNYTVG